MNRASCIAAMSVTLLLSVVSLLAQSLPATPLRVGDPAPDFTLRDQDGRPISLSDFKGKKNVVLAFYVLAFTPG